MLKVVEIAFTCYPVTDMARARKFYEEILHLKPTMVVGEAGGMQWTEYDIGAGTLSLGAGAPDWHPRSDGCSVGLEMEDFDSAIAELKSKGVKFKMEPFPTPVCHRDVEYDELVKGYEIAKDQYVRLTPSELDQLRATESEAMEIVEFVPLTAIDPI